MYMYEWTENNYVLHVEYARQKDSSVAIITIVILSIQLYIKISVYRFT